jgi:hypothetical protein
MVSRNGYYVAENQLVLGDAKQVLEVARVSDDDYGQRCCNREKKSNIKH